MRDDEIVVTLPGTTYTVTYYKPDRSPQLLARLISDKDDKRVALTLSEFPACSHGAQEADRMDTAGLLPVPEETVERLRSVVLRFR